MKENELFRHIERRRGKATGWSHAQMEDFRDAFRHIQRDHEQHLRRTLKEQEAEDKVEEIMESGLRERIHVAYQRAFDKTIREG